MSRNEVRPPIEVSISRVSRHDPTFELLREHLISVDYTPYPNATADHLAKIHAFWVASSEGAKLTEENISVKLTGVIGVVLCDLGLQRMEAYIQTLYVVPSFRRLGVGTQLLQRCLSDLTSRSSDTTSIRTASSPCLTRIRLHTMVYSSSTEKYLSSLREFLTKLWEVQAGDPLADEAGFWASNAKLFDAVRRTYEANGFVVRKNCYRYYGCQADGIEMVKELENRKRHRQ